MKKITVIWAIALIVGGCLSDTVWAQTQMQFEVSSSPNPVGSGARALGMGGAFIGVADDATAASWNPGGLVQLKTPEISFVVNGIYRSEDNTFHSNPEADGKNSISEYDINYLSVVYPFHLWNRNMILSLNYQHLYDFYREWDDVTIAYPPLILESLTVNTNEQIRYEQTGSLSALGLAYCIQIIPQLSFGLTLNFWDEGLMDNEWETHYHRKIVTTSNMPGFTNINEITETENYRFSGWNFNIGMLWRATSKLSVGVVFKSPFTADIEQDTHINSNGMDIPQPIREFELDMPMSYGIGVAYRFSDRFTMSADLYRTEWDDMTMKDLQSGEERSPVTGKSVQDSDGEPTHQVRMGAEYLFMNPNRNYVIPVRCGIFYDPAPAESSPDDYYGFSLGSGFAISKFVFDIAYQYRFGNDVGSALIQGYDFSQDINEHMAYFSVIVHF